MVKYINGENRKSTVEEVMNHVNLHLDRKTGDAGNGTELLGRHYAELTEYMERLNEEFDVMGAAPAISEGGLKGMVKRAVAKCAGWYTRDRDKRQTDFNMHVIYALNSERAIVEELIRRSGGGAP